MDLEVLRHVAAELHELLLGGFISKIFQPLPREIVLRIRLPRGKAEILMLSADPKLGRIHLTKLRIPNPPSPPRFCAFLRAHFQGSRILQVRTAEDDRVVTIRGVRGPKSSPKTRDLVLEILGRDSNILLVDHETNTIMDCLHRIPKKKTSTRTVLPGEMYQPPPRGHARPRDSVEDSRLQDARPAILTAPNGTKRLTLKPLDHDAYYFDTVNDAADALFGPLLQSFILENLKRLTRMPLKTRIRSLERRALKIEADITRLEIMDALRDDGELLKTYLKSIRKGTTEVQVKNWSGEGFRTITLNPALNPVENMNRFFSKAAKGKRGLAIARKRLHETLEEKRAFEDQMFLVAEASDQVTLEGCFSEASSGSAGAASDQKDRQQGVGPSKSHSMYKEFRSPSGMTVFVGRSGTGNAYLLRHKARKGDLWLHVKDVAGAHVILSIREGEPKVSDKEFAVGLAVHFSKGRGIGKVEVMMADAKDVSLVKGSVPGRVLVKKYVSVFSDSSIDFQD